MSVLASGRVGVWACERVSVWACESVGVLAGGRVNVWVGERVERGSSAVECRTRNLVSQGSNPPLLPLRKLGIFVLFTDAPVASAV